MIEEWIDIHIDQKKSVQLEKVRKHEVTRDKREWEKDWQMDNVKYYEQNE